MSANPEAFYQASERAGVIHRDGFDCWDGSLRGGAFTDAQTERGQGELRAPLRKPGFPQWGPRVSPDPDPPRVMTAARRAHGPLSPQALSPRQQMEGTREGFGADPTGSPLSTRDPGQMNYLTSTGLNLLDCRSQTVIPA